jgi:hypothetical protein
MKIHEVFFVYLTIQFLFFSWAFPWYMFMNRYKFHVKSTILKLTIFLTQSTWFTTTMN